MNQLQSLVGQLIRVGIVVSTNDENGTARVQFQDKNGLVSYDLPIIVRNTSKNQDYWMPDIREQVICLFLPSGVETGYILGSFYSNVTKPKVTTKNKRRNDFEDGTSVEYDRESHTLTIDVPPDGGKVIVNAHTSVVVNSPKIDLGEDSALEPSVLGDKIAAALDELRVELENHQHIGNLGAPTSPAMQVQPFEFLNLLSGGNSYSQKNRNQ
ncbi:MAG: phage baseplate assembly protein V [Methyloprofundus sp.]|nr:phage baseplate assembly protein V [Methyloprofundus sp.]